MKRRTWMTPAVSGMASVALAAGMASVALVQGGEYLTGSESVDPEHLAAEVAAMGNGKLNMTAGRIEVVDAWTFAILDSLSQQYGDEADQAIWVTMSDAYGGLNAKLQAEADEAAHRLWNKGRLQVDDRR